ncbi:DUF4148 domain-containing protein [Comamonas composti]|uniref:DUF4148 domain-containing protein n=1 Tax=Comamonas composti TaxID=408558 RepID=UPI0003F6EA6D|nr:DUF4148 domain-containing protein [Comamonas composti]
MKARIHPNSVTLMAAAIAASAGLALPGVAAADTYWHPANNEAGVKVYPEHFQSSKTRAQVRAETVEAMRNGGLSRFESNYPAAAPSQPSTLTRQQVIDALRSETMEQREARLSAMRG